MGIFIPLCGEMTEEINLYPFTLDKYHIQIFTHSYIARIIKRSEDSKCVGLIFSRKYWEQVLMESHYSNVFSRFVPCIRINDEQHKQLLSYYNLIRTQYNKGSNKEIIKHLITGMFIEVGDIYKTQIENVSTNSEQLLLMNRFLKLIYKNYINHRDVAFYAKELSLTQRYFTTTIRKTSGESALKWIEKYVVLEAQLLLNNTDLRIKEIAAQLNFDDVSFFCKYFKRVTGVSPEQYRTK